MIIVEIYVPYMDQKYEFKLNEDVAISVVIDDICSVICEKEQCQALGNKDQVMLFNADAGVALSRGKSLYESNITTGDKLILV